MSQNPWSETVIWQGTPHLRTEVISNVTFFLIYCFTFTVFYLVYDRVSHPDEIIFTLAAGLTLVPIFVVVAVVLSYRHHRYQYVVTPARIYLKKGKTWESYPLERVLSIEVKKAFFVQQLGTYLCIQIDVPISGDPIRTVTNHIQLQHLESPYTVKEIIAHAVESAKMQIPPQKPWSEHVLWKGKPHFLKAMISSAALLIVGIVIGSALFIVSNWVRGQGTFMLGGIISSLLILTLILLVILGALGSSVYLQHQYVVTPTHLHVKKKSFWDIKKGSTWESYSLENILSVDIRKCFFVPQLGLCLDICVDLSDSEFLTRPPKYIRLEYIESSYTVKEIIEKAVEAAKNSLDQ